MISKSFLAFSSKKHFTNYLLRSPQHSACYYFVLLKQQLITIQSCVRKNTYTATDHEKTTLLKRSQQERLHYEITGKNFTKSVCLRIFCVERYVINKVCTIIINLSLTRIMTKVLLHCCSIYFIRKSFFIAFRFSFLIPLSSFSIYHNIAG